MPAATLDLVKSGTTNRALEQGAAYRLTVTWKTGTPDNDAAILLGN